MKPINQQNVSDIDMEKEQSIAAAVIVAHPDDETIWAGPRSLAEYSNILVLQVESAVLMMDRNSLLFLRWMFKIPSFHCYQEDILTSF